METKIAILRGINVGGKRIIRMDDLKKLCTQLGWQKVTSYIQSGNLIFKSDQPIPELEKQLAEAIQEQYGFEVPVIIRTADEIKQAVQANSYYTPDVDVNKLHLTFLKQTPDEELLKATQKLSFEPDQFVIQNKDVFLYCEGKYHQTKLSNQFFEKQLKVSATTRNWKTILKFLELSQD